MSEAVYTKIQLLLGAMIYRDQPPAQQIFPQALDFGREDWLVGSLKFSKDRKAFPETGDL